MLDTGRLVLQINASAAARQARMLPPQVWRVLRLFDGHRSLLEALDESPLGRSTTLAVVRRLAELGLVRSFGHAPRATLPRLSPRTREWLGRPIPASKELPLEGNSLEAALDAALGCGSAPIEHEMTATDLRAIPEPRERTLNDVLQLRIPDGDDPSEELIEALRLAEKVRRHLEGASPAAGGPMVIMGANAPELTTMENDFFDSYQPEIPDNDDFMDLVLEPPTLPH